MLCLVLNGSKITNVFFLFKLQVFSLGVLIAASVAISAINELEAFDEVNHDFNAESYRAAAGWLILVASAAIIYHIAMIIVRMIHMTSSFRKQFKIYILTVSTRD